MKTWLPFSAVVLVGLSWWLTSCQPVAEQSTVDDKLLARVHGKSLHISDLEGMIPESSNATDSMLFINAFVERWVRESLLMHEAEKNISQDLNIDQLVKDYRASLIRYNYEKLLTERQLDSTISREILDEYYEAHKAQYTLENTVFRGYFIKIPADAPDLDQLKTWWKDESPEAFRNMIEYSSHFATIYMLEDSSWYKRDDIMEQLPTGRVKKSDFKAAKNFSFKEEGYYYFLRIFEVIRANNTAPLNYVKDQITRLILHERKIKMLDEKKEEIYEREIRRNNVKIYTN